MTITARDLQSDTTVVTTINATEINY
jgi:hypothetical protein